MLEVANLAIIVSQVCRCCADGLLPPPFKIVPFQIWFLDVFLHNSFTRSGLEVVRWMFSDPANREDTMILLFPRQVHKAITRHEIFPFYFRPFAKSLVNCNVRMGGTGTGIQVVNAICVLSVNVYNEIVFVVLWFWLFFLALATAAHVLYLALLTAFPTVGIAVKSLGMDEESKVGRELNLKDPHDM